MTLIIALFLFSVHDAHWSLYLATSVYWLLEAIGRGITSKESKCRL